MLEPQPSGMHFHYSSTDHPVVMDSLELGYKPSSKLSMLKKLQAQNLLHCVNVAENV